MADLSSKPASLHLVRDWDRVLDHVGSRLTNSDGTSLLRRLRPSAVTPSQLKLEAPDRITLLCVQDNFLGFLHEAVSAVLGPRQIVIDLPMVRQGELFPATFAQGSPSHGVPKSALRAKYTFVNFVVGPSNQFAHAASLAVAHQPGTRYNPLFLYGGTGLGKTHLANAIGHELLARRPAYRVLYLSAHTFMAELIGAIRRGRMREFKARFRDVDTLILDDAHQLAGREQTQEEFFHTFNSLYDRHRQIVITAEQAPHNISALQERLRNRFEWGLVADIQPPDIETRTAILQKMADAEGLLLPPEAAVVLAGHAVSNVRELESLLTRLGAYASLHHRPISVELARQTVQTSGIGSAMITVEMITKTVCDHFSLRPRDLHSHRRSRNVAIPRQVTMYLCRKLLGASFVHIGELFDRDHSTVMHANAVIARRMREDPAFQTTVERLEQKLRAQ